MVNYFLSFERALVARNANKKIKNLLTRNRQVDMIVEYFSNGPNVSERTKKLFFKKTLDTNLRNMILLISRFDEATR